MCRSARLYNCARCSRQVIICSHCDRGNIYCADNCFDLSRKEKLKQAQKRYEQTAHAKELKAKRQKQYRQRKKEKATHQGSIQLALYDLLLIELEKLKNKVKKRHFTQYQSMRCHFCGSTCSDYLRLFFLERTKPSTFPVFC
jgi:hypothetical protein